MSGIPIIGKIFEAIEDSPILGVIAIAAAVYFTAGAATGSFTSAGASTAAAGGTTAATTAANVGAATAATAPTVTAAAIPGITAPLAGTGAGAMSTALPAISTAAEAGALATATAAETAGASWFAKNPLATMMLGQGVIGAVSGAAADEKAAEERKSRGLFGFDYEGKRAGVVGSRMDDVAPPEAQTTQAAAAPVIASQQVAPVGAPQQIPVQRKDLPKLNQTGQLAVG